MRCFGELLDRQRHVQVFLRSDLGSSVSGDEHVIRIHYDRMDFNGFHYRRK